MSADDLLKARPIGCIVSATPPTPRAPRNDEGVQLADRNTARHGAIVHAGACITHEPERLKDRDVRVKATDGWGPLLFTVITLTSDAPAIRSAH